MGSSVHYLTKDELAQNVIKELLGLPLIEGSLGPWNDE